MIECILGAVQFVTCVLLKIWDDVVLKEFDYGQGDHEWPVLLYVGEFGVNFIELD